ncbi:tetratricopeptide repeat protein [Roseiconus lacunae]|uniref:tetratricopeptide repeat protein n=1 Tax=Roseiconus lacunae TaxID=2605694 RepID=UPI0011F0B498|nr:tetratricopeptide repeat protein [Roseiconus lacunae]
MQKSIPPPRQNRQPHRLSKTKRIAFSLIVCLTLLGTGELLLRLTWTPPAPTDPFVGFSAAVPLLVESDSAATATGKPVIEINSAKWTWFNPQSFEAVKPEGTYRIVCLGGSTTYGRPFDDSTSFCGWLRELLPAVDDSKHWQVINAGGISYASYRIAEVMRQFAAYEVDLFILYTGQNEFLEWRTYGDTLRNPGLVSELQMVAEKSRLGQFTKHLVDRSRSEPLDESHQLSADVDEMLNHTVGPSSYQRDDKWQQDVLEHFRFNLNRMRQLSRRAGAELAVVTPVSNLRECEPFKSEFSRSVSEDDSDRLRQGIATAKDLLAVEATADAVQILKHIVEVDPRHAHAQYWLGRAYFAEGQTELAEACFLRAIDEDICPLRATTDVIQSIRRFVNQANVIDIDYRSVAVNQSEVNAGHRCLGSEWFLDHVHPTIDGHGELARLIIDRLYDHGIVAGSVDDEIFDQTASVIHSRVGRHEQGIAFRNLAKLTHWAGKFDDAQRHALDALRLIDGDVESRYVLADCLAKEGQLDAAVEMFEQLFRSGGFPRAALPYGELLAAQGRYDEAKAFLLEAALVGEGARQKAALNSLGWVHEQLGEQELAEECFAEAAKIR